MKKYRIKRFDGEEWREAESIDEVIDASRPYETFIVAQNCDCEETEVRDGMRRCKRCRDVLEITSYRGL